MKPKQLKLAIPKTIRPPKPSFRDERIALRIAERIVSEVNFDEFYWTESELPDRIWDVQQEIMRHGNVLTVLHRLHKAENSAGGGKYGWEGIDEHCRVIAKEIIEEEVDMAVNEWRQRYYA